VIRAASLISTIVLAAPLAHADDVLPPQIVHEPCDELKRGESFEIWARFYDESAIFDPKVIYRVGDSSAWKNAPFSKQPGSDDFMAVIRAKELRGPLEYFIEAFDENGNGPARYGSPDTPIRVAPSNSPKACNQLHESSAPAATLPSSTRPPEHAPPPPVTAAPTTKPITATETPLIVTAPPPAAPGSCDQATRPIWCEPLFWGAVGAVAVVGAGVATYFLFFSDDGTTETPPANDKVRLNIGAPDPTVPAWRGR
jgi:hypothetical protein